MSAANVPDADIGLIEGNVEHGRRHQFERQQSHQPFSDHHNRICKNNIANNQQLALELLYSERIWGLKTYLKPCDL